MSRVRVKICGVTRLEDAERAVALGADLLGLNFWPGSPRCLEPAAARRIAEAVRDKVGLVGVFVNQPAAEIQAVEAEVGLDLVQLHGDEGPEEVALFGSRVLKALRFREAPRAEAFASFPGVWGFLVEARRADAYGGVGQDWDYAAAGSLRQALGERPLLIAGGLGPENVAAAIAAARPWGVDVASGVESAPGVKDAERLEKFFAEVQHAAS